MKILNEEQVFSLRLNIHTNIWTTGFIELDLDETYKTPFGTLICKPGTGWHFIGSSLLTEFLQNHGNKYAFDCPIIKKLHKKKTSALVIKLLGYPHNIKCWI